MDRQEALKALTRAGKRRDAIETIEKWCRKAEDRYKHTESDTTRTTEYRRWALAVDFTQINNGLTDELVSMAQRVVSVDQGDAQKVFGIDGISGDKATLIISRRDAGDRVSKIQNRGELLEMLDRATRSGDEVMARAVAERALEIKDAKALERFAEARPHLDSAVTRLWKAERQEEDGGMAFTMALMALRPAELHNMPIGTIESLAYNEPVGA